MNLLHYLLGASVAIFLVLNVVLSLWVYICTKDLDFTVSLVIYESAKKHKKLTQGQGLLLEATKCFKLFTLACGALVIVFELISMSIQR